MVESLRFARRLFLAVCVFAVVSSPSLAGARLELISVSSTGEQGNADSPPANEYLPLSVSADGRFVAFTSVATNLVPGDTNGVEDIFVRDRLLGVTERVSVGSGGEQANGPSACCTISGDGRFVAFASVASNLVPGDLNGSCGAFVHDRATGVTELVSVSTTGEQGNGISGPEVISADGRFVVFGSNATNLTPEYYEYVPWDWHLYLRDRLTGTTELISVDPASLPLEGRCTHAAISADGRFIAFSLESDPEKNGSLGPHMGSDVLLRDREARTTEVVTLTETGEAPDGRWAYPGSMSGDGRFIAFVSDATNLAPETVYTGGRGVFVRDRVAGTVECAGEGLHPMISGDGRTVVFTSSGGEWLSLWNRRTGSIEDMCCFSVSSDGRRVDDPWVSHDGRVVAFSSAGAPEIGPVDTNNARDVFVWEPLPPDLDYDDWASDEIRACAKWGMIVGYPDGLYHPELEVTRDQMAVDVARVLAWGDDRIPDPEPPPTFSDVPADYWAYKHIEYAVSQKVADGYEDGTYQPSLTVDRGQMAVYVARALVAPTGEAAIADPEPPYAFPDVPGEDSAWSWCLKHVEYLAGKGLVEGYEDGLYHPEYAVTRDQVAVIIARAFELTLGFHPLP